MTAGTTSNVDLFTLDVWRNAKAIDRLANNADLNNK
jgi:hypothetical protein